MSRVVAADYYGRTHVSNSQDEIDRLVHNLQKNIVVEMDQQACAEVMEGLK